MLKYNTKDSKIDYKHGFSVEKNRAAEVMMVPEDDIGINCKSTQSPKSLPAPVKSSSDNKSASPKPVPRILRSLPPSLPNVSSSTSAVPKSAYLLKSVDTLSFCQAVCYHNGITYLGTQNKSIDIIDKAYNYSEKFVSDLPGAPCGIAALDHQLFCLSSVQEESEVCSLGAVVVLVVDTTSKCVSQWDGSAASDQGRPCLTSNMFLVPNRSEEKITVNSLSGEEVKCIACPKAVTLCSVEDNSVVATDYHSNKVFRVNIITGQTEWTSSNLWSPEGIATYGKDYVCVVSKRTLRFLNIHTG